MNRRLLVCLLVGAPGSFFSDIVVSKHFFFGLFCSISFSKILTDLYGYITADQADIYTHQQCILL